MTNSTPIKDLQKALEDAHTAMAVAIAFCNRGPRPEKLGDPAPASCWAEMCAEIATELSKADQIALEALAKPLPPTDDVRAKLIDNLRDFEQVIRSEVEQDREGNYIDDSRN